MRHLKSGRKLNRTRAHRKALLHNLATQLFEHKRIRTTEAKAKELRPFAESIITRAKNAYLAEKNGTLTSGLTIDLHARRVVGKLIRNKPVLQELFDVIAPKVAERPGGYTRIIKTNYRRGDGGSAALIELVDWAGSQDGPVTINQKKKIARKTTEAVKPAQKTKVEEVAVVEEVAPIEVIEDVVEETPVVEETTEVIEEVIETPAEVEEATEVVDEVVAEVPTETAVEETAKEETAEENEEKPLA